MLWRIFIAILYPMQNKVSSVVFKYGSGGDDLVVARKVDLESRFTGWLHAILPGKSLLPLYAYLMCRRRL